MIVRFFFYSFAMGVLFVTAHAYAQTLTSPDTVGKAAQTYQNIETQKPAPPTEHPSKAANQPLEITADGALEWHRQDKKFIARNNAVATQGEASIAAHTLTADYTEGKGSGLNIRYVTALQNVVITSRDSRAYGDKATYDITTGKAHMTGEHLKLTSPDQTLTARDYFEYQVTAGTLTAVGNAKIERLNNRGQLNTLEADTISATLGNNNKGQRVLKTLEARGNVVIITPTETINGTYGIYNADTNKADLSGGVTIRRGPNILEGERAEVDLNTDTSRLFGSKTTGGTGNGRVRGVFYPDSEKKN